jgi:hypothetical protein
MCRFLATTGRRDHFRLVETTLLMQNRRDLPDPILRIGVPWDSRTRLPGLLTADLHNHSTDAPGIRNVSTPHHRSQFHRVEKGKGPSHTTPCQTTWARPALLDRLPKQQQVRIGRHVVLSCISCSWRCCHYHTVTGPLQSACMRCFIMYLFNFFCDNCEHHQRKKNTIKRPRPIQSRVAQRLLPTVPSHTRCFSLFLVPQYRDPASGLKFASCKFRPLHADTLRTLFLIP